MYTQNIPFDSEDNYTFDSDLVEITGGVAKLKNRTPTDLIFYANYNNNENANLFSGTRTGTLNNGATVSGGNLVITGGDNRSCSYNEDNISTLTGAGCIRIVVIPNTTNPTNDFYVFDIGSTKCYMRIDGTGNLRFTLKDDANDSIWTPIISKATMNYQVGVPIEIEVNWDQSTPEQYLFVDGALVSSGTNAGTRSTPFSSFDVGNPRAGITAQVEIDKIAIYSTLQHSSAYTPDWSDIPNTKFSLANPKVIVNATWRMEQLQKFEATETKTGSDEIKYIQSKNSKDFYLQSGSFVPSNGTYGQADVDEDIETYRANFTSSVVNYGLVFFLHSEDGNTTPQVSNIEIGYDYAGESPDDIDKCTVWGYSVYGDGTPNLNDIFVSLNKKKIKYKDNITIRPKGVVVRPREQDGYWEVELIETTNMSDNAKWIFDFGNALETRSVPDEDTRAYEDLI